MMPLVPKVTSAHTQEVRKRLIDAGQMCLLDRGYEGTSARDIMERAGVSAGTLYHYFDSKDDLFAAIAERFLESVSASVEGVTDAQAKLMDVVYGNFVRARPRSLQPALRARAPFDERIRTTLTRYDEAIERALQPLVEDAQRSGAIREDVDVDALIEVVALCFEGLEARVGSNTLRTSRERIGLLLLDLLSRGVAVADAPS